MVGPDPVLFDGLAEEATHQRQFLADGVRPVAQRVGHVPLEPDEIEIRPFEAVTEIVVKLAPDDAVSFPGPEPPLLVEALDELFQIVGEGAAGACELLLDVAGGVGVQAQALGLQAQVVELGVVGDRNASNNENRRFLGYFRRFASNAMQIDSFCRILLGAQKHFCNSKEKPHL